jgi:hypothetical protein
MLTLADVKKDCPLQRGLQLDDVGINIVYCDPDLSVSKGLYLPLALHAEENSESLKNALYNGAIATLWRKDHSLPTFLPTHFPVFIVDDPLESIEVVIKNYLHSLALKGTNTVDTKFSFSMTNQHIDDNISYVDSVKDIIINLTNRIESVNSEMILYKQGGEEQ